MNFEHYSVDDFLANESFYQFVKYPNSQQGVIWKKWLIEHPEKKEEVSKAKRIISNLQFEDKSLDKEEITAIWNNISTEISREVGFSRRKIGGIFNASMLLKAAAIFLPFLVAAFAYLFFLESPVEEPAISQSVIEKYNPKGQKLTVFLSDGSRIKLNAESSIIYKKPFDENQRIVTLEGEAFFEVAPDKERPFIVKTGEVTTKVLGTSFNINAYPEGKKIDIAVKSGIVTVENTGQKSIPQQNKAILLSPSEMARFIKKDARISVMNYNPKEVLGWSEGTLYFNDVTMEEFVSRIERWYGIDIIVQRKAPIKKGIVGEFTDQSLEEILLGIHEASEFEYEFKGEKVIIK
jgi:ferric-dicitrate binding protein FerR (iron transport regulator)